MYVTLRHVMYDRYVRVPSNGQNTQCLLVWNTNRNNNYSIVPQQNAGANVQKFSHNYHGHIMPLVANLPIWRARVGKWGLVEEILSNWHMHAYIHIGG